MLASYRTHRLAAVAVLLGSLACAAPAFAADATPATPAPAAKMHMHHKHHEGKEGMEGMRQHVEERIKTLHAKLNITAEQESAWSDVADAMRNSEKDVIALIHERHEHAKTLTAVEDLESYQKIAQAHADGLDKVASAFSTLYDKMSDEQKANADKVFGGFEGHERGKDDMQCHHDGMKPAGKK